MKAYVCYTSNDASRTYEMYVDDKLVAEVNKLLAQYAPVHTVTEQDIADIWEGDSEWADVVIDTNTSVEAVVHEYLNDEITWHEIDWDSETYDSTTTVEEFPYAD